MTNVIFFPLSFEVDVVDLDISSSADKIFEYVIN